MHALENDAADGSKFIWAIGLLPDGRFIAGFPKNLKQWNIPIVAEGDHDDLYR